MQYAPYTISVDHLPTDLQRTEVATRRYAQVSAAKQRRTAGRRSGLLRRRSARV